jgi:hypothetical protein
MAGTVTDQLKRICRKMGGVDVSGSVTDLLARIERLAGTLPDGALINGVANFYRSAKPTTRVDGSALVIGDRWINPVTGVEGFWNGTYWLSNQVRQSSGRVTGVSASIVITNGVPAGAATLPQEAIFIAFGKISISGPAASETDYWQGQLGYLVHTTSAGGLIGSSVNMTTNVLSVGIYTLPINLFLAAGISARPMAVQLTKVGSPANIAYAIEYYYHFVL